MLFSMLASVAISALLALVSVNGLDPDSGCQLVDCFELTIVEPKCASRNDVLWALAALNNTIDSQFYVAINRTENGKECWWSANGVSSMQDYQEVRNLVNLVKDPKAQGRTHVYKSSVPLTGTTLGNELPPYGKEPKTATRMTVMISGCALTGYGGRSSPCLQTEKGETGLDWGKKPK